jgi:putative DNA primase/helicase
MTSNNSFPIRYSEGTGRNFGKATNKTKPWNLFKKMFKTPVRTSERFRHYLKLPDKDQSFLKSTNGWLYRTAIDGKSRNRQSGLPSDILSADFDYATPEFFAAMRSGEGMPDYEYFLHTSRRHTEENPRFRLFVLLKEPVPNDFYNAVSRIILNQFDPEMTNVDKVSFRPAQMMFKPTASADSPYVFDEHPGQLVDWSAELDNYELVRGDWRDITNLPHVPNEQLRETSEKMEDPRQKEGVVGFFCRAYDIFQAMEAFDLPYTPTDDTGPDPRFTYTGGTTYNGAIVYDDGLFLYSHHGSDPVADMEVNAFDLVRMHKFAELDDADELEKTITKRASWKAMLDLCQNDEKYVAEQVNTRFDMAAMNDDLDDAMDDVEVDENHVPKPPKAPAETDATDDTEDDFGDIPQVEESTGAPLEPTTDRIVGLTGMAGAFERKRRPKPPSDWITKLALTKDGIIQSNLPNVTQVLDNDLRFRNSVAMNEHMQEIVLIRPFKSGLGYVPSYEVRDAVNGDLWIDGMTGAARTLMESPSGPGKRGYDFKPTDRDMKAGLTNMSRQAAFHPIQDYLNYCAETCKDTHEEAEDRLSRLWIKYLGSPDDDYHRHTALKFMVACVARAFEPGHKFDYSPILHGAQGVGKSTFVAILAQHWYGELSADFSDAQKLVEQMQGCWIMELPELSSITRGQVEDVKAFISGTKIKARLAYNARAENYLRQTCFIGSTNDTTFLIDTTGNRRWWPVEARTEAIDLEELRREIADLWGAATMVYKSMRASQPEGYLPLYLSDPSVRKLAEEMQDDVRVEGPIDMLAASFADFLDMKVSPEEHDDFADVNGEPHKRHYRDRVCIAQLKDHLDLKQVSPNWSREVGKALGMLGWVASKHPEKFHGYGKPRVYKPGPAVLAQRMKEMLNQNEQDDIDDLI